MSDFPPDPDLDAQLRDVPLPEGFRQRLQGSIAPTDEQLDAQLRSVRVSPLMLARWRMTPDDIALDDAVLEVELPISLTWRLRGVTGGNRWRRARQQAGRLAVAAALFMAVSVALFSTAGALLTAVYPPVVEDDFALAVIYDGPLEIATEQVAAVAGIEPDYTIRPGVTSDPPPFLAELRPLPRWDEPLAIAEPEFLPTSPAAPVAQFVSLFNSGFRPFDDVVLLRYGILGAPQLASDDLPDLESLELTPARGIEPPRVRGYNREFFLRTHLHPPIAPSAHQALRTLTVPLRIADDSFRRVQALTQQGRRPQASDVRVEDFIAALDYHYPPAAPGRLGLRTAAGPSLFGSPDAGMLQVGVQAGPLAQRDIPATHLILAIDVSASMGRGDKLAAVRQGVRRLIEQLAPRDRISLVVFGEEVLELVEHAGRADAAAIEQLLETCQAAGGTNLAVGLQQAASLALAANRPAGPQARLALITDSRASMTEETFSKLEEVLQSAADADARLVVLDVAERTDPDPVLSRLTESVEGEIRPVHDRREIYAALLELTMGHSVVAAEAQLTLRFNPQCVAAYRLLGHEANAMAGLTAVTTTAELRAGDAATALVEIWFQQNENDDVGEAEVTWRDPVSGKSHKLRQRISRLQFASTLAETPPALQAAAMAAETAELLRGSHTTLRELNLTTVNSRGFAGVLDVARRSSPSLQKRADFQQLLRLVELLERNPPR